MNKSLVLLLAVFAIGCVNTAHLGKNEHGIDIFTIDMDMAPKYRFNETSLYYKEQVHVIVDMYLSLCPDFLLFLVDLIGKMIFYVQPENHEELEGMAYALDVDTYIVFFLQYVYEFSAFCTSTVVKLPDGTLMLDRNLDFAFSAAMRNLTYIARYT